MGPTLLLDKSSFQALSQEEMLKLSNYFDWNRVDILLLEIIGDFCKKTRTLSSRNVASILSDKISIVDSYQNINYRELLVHNLLGDHVTMDGRPIIQTDTVTQLANGHTGAFIDETLFCEMIHRWQLNEFTEKDISMANMWGNIKANCMAKADNYLPLLTAHHVIFPACNDITSMKIEIDKLLRNPHIQNTFLDMFLSYQGIETNMKRVILSRVKQSPYLLQKAAPYAFYCLCVFALFLGAYKHDLLPKKKSDDQIDLEYLFYLPFCKVFSSNDKFHSTLAPQLINEEQVFVLGTDLKTGIRNVDNAPIYEETMTACCDPIPPMAKDSLIRNIWISTKWLYN